MPKCIIDGKEVEFTPGQNLIEVARTAGVEIPYFCYHPGMSVVAQCRMCAVEVEKMPKLQTACSMAPTDGMVVKTKSEKTLKNQKAVMEFLLVNHPLDCPVCDQSGECDLQDHSFKHGDAYMRTTEDRRTYIDLDMGPVIQKNMNRCIHCTRCIRFGDEIAGIHEMVAVKRGNNTEITTIDGKQLQTQYAGNYADICPTGSLTIKDFRFKKRVWFLKKTPTVCEGCSRGCNIELHQDADVIYRTVPRTNMEVNKYWICDEGRFNYQYVHDADRVITPAVRTGGTLEMSIWKEAVTAARETLKGKKVAVLVGSDLTQEEGKLLLDFSSKQWAGSQAFHFGTPGITSAAQDTPEDKILRRTSKTSNLQGLEKLGYKGFTSLPHGVEAVVVFRGGRAVVPEVKGIPVVGVGVFNRKDTENYAAVLPGQSFAEKDGTVVNFEGREQKIKRAIRAPRECKGLSEVLMMWSNL